MIEQEILRVAALGVIGGVIYVPRGSLAAYTSAANYPSSSTYTYVEYDP